MANVLIVEDDQNLASVLEILLDKHFTLVAHTLKDAEKFFYSEDHQEPVDLMILDLMLPDGSGLDFFRKLVSDGIHPATAMISSHESTDIVAEFMRSGGRHYFQKPFLDLGALSRKLDHALVEAKAKGMKTEERLKRRVKSQMDLVRNQFISSVSHEIRLPLSVSLGNMKMLKKDLDLLLAAIGPYLGTVDLDTQDDLKKIEANFRQDIKDATYGLNRLDRFFQNMLSLNKIENVDDQSCFNFQPHDLHDHIESMFVQYIREYESVDSEVTYSLESEIPPGLIFYDAGYLDQVFQNLISNASKFCYSGTVKVFVGQTDTEIVCAVRDTGMGIPEGDLDIIFSKFVRGGNCEGIEGTGIGLNLCKRIAEAHGGKIWARNNSSGGATVTFTISKTLGGFHA